jgi:hypothetical protein
LGKVVDQRLGLREGPVVHLSPCYWLALVDSEAAFIIMRKSGLEKIEGTINNCFDTFSLKTYTILLMKRAAQQS